VQQIESSRGLLEIKTSSDGTIVLDTDAAADANERILSRYRITRDRSRELEGITPPLAAAKG
jgi:PDZ domain